MSQRLDRLYAFETALGQLDDLATELEAVRAELSEDNEELAKLTKLLEAYARGTEKTETRLYKLESTFSKEIVKLQELFAAQYNDLSEGLEQVDERNALSDALDLSTA